MTQTAALCDTHEMVVVHRVFRREFRLLPDMVRAVSAGDTRRAWTVAQHAREMVTELHHHHTGEDELLWPKLQERASLESELIDRMERQHERISLVLDEVEGLLPQWAESADPDDRDQLVRALRQVTVGLDEHLAEEEAHVLPVVEQHITADEWHQLGERAIAAMPKSRLLVFLGYILEEATPEETVVFLHKIPVPGRIAYRLVGRRRYQREVARLRVAA